MVCAVLAIIKLGFDDMRLGVVDEVKFGELVEPYLYSRQDTGYASCSWRAHEKFLEITQWAKYGIRVLLF